MGFITVFRGLNLYVLIYSVWGEGGGSLRAGTNTSTPSAVVMGGDEQYKLCLCELNINIPEPLIRKPDLHL